MKKFRFPDTPLAYWLPFLLGLALRLALLGAQPLSDFEANWALQALDLAKNQAVELGPQPGYVLLTRVLFSLFGSSDFAARLLPALAGASLAFLPLLLQRWLSPRVGLGLAFALALDPGLLAVSRTAGSPALAVSFGFLLLGALLDRRYPLAGLLAGLALLSGTDILPGLVLAGLVYAIWQVISRRSATQEEEPVAQNASQVRLGLYLLAGVLVGAGTLLLQVPQGLGAAAAALPAYLAGWAQPASIPAGRLAFALLAYQPLAVIYGLVGGVGAWLSPSFGRENRLARLSSLWVALGLLVTLLYPARQVADLVWLLPPLWFLAVRELDRHLNPVRAEANRLVSGAQAILLVILLVFGWIYLASIANASLADAAARQASQANALYLFLSVIAMGVVTTLLVSLGWSWQIGQRGLALGLVLALGTYSLAASFSAARLAARSGVELWDHQPTAAQADLLTTTLEDLSAWRMGHIHQIDLASSVTVPSLRWALRDFGEARFVSELPVGETASVILTPGDLEDPLLAANYRGQDFVWSTAPAWGGALPPDLPAWLAFRNSPEEHGRVILWARVDLFPDGAEAGKLDLLQQPAP